MLLDSLFTCNSNQTDYTEFYHWEKAVQSLLYQCFTRVSAQENKSTNQSLDVYGKLREIDNLIKFQQSNINLRKEKEELLNNIHLLEEKASDIYNELKSLDLNDKLNPDSFYKIKKTNNKTS